MNFVGTLTYLLAGGFSCLLGALAVLAGARFFGDTAWAWFLEGPAGGALQIALGVGLLLVGSHFVRLLVAARASAMRLRHRSERGSIELANVALRQFVSDVLRRELGLSRFRVRLERGEGGLVVGVRIGLSSSDTVTDIGERIQRVIAERVSERVGVEVERVEILVRSMRQTAPHAASGEDATTAG